MGTMKLVNLTPNTLELCGSDWKLPPSGKIAKCTSGPRIMSHKIVDPDGDPDFIDVMGMGQDRETYLYDKIDRRVHPLPEETPNTILVVSVQVRLSNPHRTDLWSPGGYERDCKGTITGFRYFESWGVHK